MPYSREYFSGLVTGQIAAIPNDVFDLVINTPWAFRSAMMFDRKRWPISRYHIVFIDSSLCDTNHSVVVKSDSNQVSLEQQN
jgi:hypothetical protein